MDAITTSCSATANTCHATEGATTTKDFMENDTINIGGIKRKGNTIEFNQENVKVAEIIDIAFVNEYYGYEEELGGITVVVHEDIILYTIFNNEMF